MTKRKGAPRSKVTDKPMALEFTKLQKRLLNTIQSKYNQAMNNELNSALVDIYEEFGYTVEEMQKDFRLREDLTGMDRATSTPPGIPPGDVKIPQDILDKIEKEKKTDGES